MKKYAFLLLLLTFVFQKTMAQVEAVKDPTLPYHYLVYYPKGYKENPKKYYPMILFLHGRSIQGTDVQKVRSYGVIYEIERGLDLDFIVVAPQCQSGWDNKKLIQVLDHAENSYRVDKSRIYLTGMSMGGYGAWYLAGAYPDRFAAVAPVCGGGNVSDATKMKALPHWVFHGAKDIPVPITESEKMVKALRDAGNKQVEFTVYKDWGHAELAIVFSKKELYEWFLKFKRGVEFIEPVEEPNTAVVMIDTKKPAENDLKPQTSSTPTKPIPNKEKEKEPEFIVFEEPRNEENDLNPGTEPAKEPSKTTTPKTPEKATATKKPAQKAKWWQIDKWKIWSKLK